MCEALLAVAGSSLKCVPSITSNGSVAMFGMCHRSCSFKFIFFIRAAFENIVHSGGFLDGLGITLFVYHLSLYPPE